ncbi:unnamed protein product [Psylliodes chrysocephalus]|uniref:O-acyltransferase WSD1 C-terminal domain-containing protein n=1 Tax=Psylliodes chrysocephalus TaxID=3402493 RepID=A0A9P0GIW3_9CUCU|nr:unnamed protein product [Psylliodes chrysocephala]
MLIPYIICSILTLPGYLIIFTLMWLLSIFVFFYIKIRYGERAVFLDSADTLFALKETYHNVSKLLLILNGNNKDEDIEANAKRVIQERLFKYPDKFGRLMCSVHMFLGYPFFLRENVTADNIVNTLEVDKSNFKNIQDILSAYSSKPLPLDNKLLWEVTFLKASDKWNRLNNLKNHQVAVIIRLNHALGDGLSFMNLCAEILGENDIRLDKTFKNIPKSAEWTKNPVMDILLKLFFFLIVPGFYIVEKIKLFINNFDGPIIVHKQVMTFKAEKTGEHLIKKLKKIKKDIGDTSFTEVLLTLISASLYTHFQSKGDHIPKILPFGIIFVKDLEPLTINGTPVIRNQFGYVVLSIPIATGSSSLLKRLEYLKKNSRTFSTMIDFQIRKFLLFHIIKFIPIPVLTWIFPLYGLWGSFSNLPEFPRIVIFNGHEVENCFFFTLNRDQLGTGFSVIGYDDRIHFGVTADINHIGSKEECDTIINDIFKNIELLRLEIEMKKI